MVSGNTIESVTALVPDLLSTGGTLITFIVTTFPLNVAVVGTVVGAIIGIVAKTRKTAK